MFQLDSKLAADTVLVASLPLCEMLLMDDSQFPWVILVPRKPNLRELVELNPKDTLQIQVESSAVSRMLLQAFHAEKLNIASLGNVVAQLHIHHIARFVHDVAWPSPVWGVVPAKAYEIEALETAVRRIKSAFKLPGRQAVIWHL